MAVLRLDSKVVFFKSPVNRLCFFRFTQELLQFILQLPRVHQLHISLDVIVQSPRKFHAAITLRVGAVGRGFGHSLSAGLLDWQLGNGGPSSSARLVTDRLQWLDRLLRHVHLSGTTAVELAGHATPYFSGHGSHGSHLGRRPVENSHCSFCIAVPTEDCWGFLLRVAQLSFEIVFILCLWLNV